MHNRLNQAQVVSVTRRIQQQPEEFTGMPAGKVARILSSDLQFRITPHNVRAIAKPLGLQLRTRRVSKGASGATAVSSVLRKLCKEIGFKDDHPIFQEIAKL